MFVVALASVGACSPPTPETLPPIAYEGEVVLFPSTVVGCYHVASLEWPSPEGARWAKLVPATFELSDAPRDDSVPHFRRVIAAEPSLRLGIWTLNDQRELIVHISGLVGVQLVLRRRPTDAMFYGRAQPTSDGALPPGVGVGAVQVKKAACER